jgi:hypothetical protein
MSTIRCIYEEEPHFPASDQHPDAVRYTCSVGIYRFVDAVGEPTVAELEAFLGLDASALADKTRLAEIDTNIQTSTIGTVMPRTVSELKAMSWTEFSAWFDLNFDTAAKVTGFVKRLGLIVIRRVL